MLGFIKSLFRKKSSGNKYIACGIYTTTFTRTCYRNQK